MQEDLEEIFRMSEEEVQAIRHYKVQELKKAWGDLFAIGIVPVLYERQPKYMDYKTFEEGFRKNSNVFWANKQTQLLKINSEIEKMDSEEEFNVFAIKLKGIEEDEFDLFDKLLYLDYSPPTTLPEISTHILILLGYYSNGNIYIPEIEMRADLSMSKLIGVVNRLYGATEARGKTILSGRKKQDENVASSKIDVFEAFQCLEIKNKPRYNSKRWVAEAIRKYLISKNGEINSQQQKKVPSEKTIIRYLESDDKIRNDLIEMGVIKDKPTLV
jgi:hypothetical protein